MSVALRGIDVVQWYDSRSHLAAAKAELLHDTKESTYF